MGCCILCPSIIVRWRWCLSETLPDVSPNGYSFDYGLMLHVANNTDSQASIHPRLAAWFGRNGARHASLQ